MIRLRRRFWLGPLATLALLLAFPPVLSRLARSALYPVPRFPVPSPPPPPLAEVRLALDGGPLSAWWLPPGPEPAPVVLMLHGNGENLATLHWSGLFARFAELGAGVLALDYPGYGRSAGRPSETALCEAAAAAWRELVGRAGSQRPRVVAGWSLGAAVAVQLAAREPASVDALALMSAWTRLDEVAKLHFPDWIAAALLYESYDSLAHVAGLRCPVLVVHGADDGLIPVAQGRRIHAALPGPKRWLEVAGAGHNDLLGHEETWQALADLLREAQRRR